MGIGCVPLTDRASWAHPHGDPRLGVLHTRPHRPQSPREGWARLHPVSRARGLRSPHPLRRLVFSPNFSRVLHHLTGAVSRPRACFQMAILALGRRHQHGPKRASETEARRPQAGSPGTHPGPHPTFPATAWARPGPQTGFAGGWGGRAGGSSDTCFGQPPHALASVSSAGTGGQGFLSVGPVRTGGSNLWGGLGPSQGTGLRRRVLLLTA